MENKKPTQKQRNSILVYNIFLAKKLMDLDYKVVDIDFNHNDPSKLVFFFEDVQGFKKDLQKLAKQK